MAKYFTEQANLFSQARGRVKISLRVKIKPESEISSHIYNYNSDKCNKWFIPQDSLIH